MIIIYLLIIVSIIIIIPFKFKISLSENELLFLMYNIPFFVKKGEKYRVFISKIIQKNENRNQKQKRNMKNIVAAINIKHIDIFLESIINNYVLYIYIYFIFIQIIEIYEKKDDRKVLDIKYNFHHSDHNSFQIDVYFDVVIGKILIYMLRKRSKYYGA